MTPFQQQAEQIGAAFQTPVSRQWVVHTGRRDLANGILNMMRSARSQEQFDEAAYAFKRNILLPYFREVVHRLPDDQRAAFIARNPLIKMMPRKNLGTYDELKKNQAFAESQYQGRPVNGQPDPQLLRIAGDPVETDLAARSLGMAPEDLQAYIRKAYADRARDQLRRDMLAAAESTRVARNRIADEYQNSFLGTTLGIVSPEVTDYTLDAVRTGRDLDGWELAKAIAKDALVGVASLYTGGAAGKAVAHPAAQAAVGGLLDAGIEAARQGMSNYSEFDPQNIAAVGTTSATMPAIIGATAGMLGSIPGMRRIINPIQRKLRGMLPDPAQEEAAAAKRLQRQAEVATDAAYEGGDELAREGADDLLRNAREFMENSPQRVFDPMPFTLDEVRDIVMDPARASRYFDPPTRENFLDMVVRKKTGDANDIVNIGGTSKYASDVAEDWLERAKKQWPEHYKKASTPSEPRTMWDKAGEALVDIGSREETMRRRAEGEKKKSDEVSASLNYLMENDPDVIRMWNAGFVPNSNDAMAKLYQEWKERFGGQR